MENNSLLYQIALPLLPEVGLRTAKELLNFFGSAQHIFEATEDEWVSLTKANISHIRKIRAGFSAALKRANEECEFINNHNIDTYYFEDSNYPFRLAQCPDAPILLYGKGNIAPNEGHFVSIVGTRSATDRGKDLCRKLVLDLADRIENLTIISGLAYGIDVTAHKAALEAGIPTIIIPGHGLDRIYPAIHRQIAIDALKDGGILTEYNSQTSPDKQNFIARNRIIAGMADAVVVVESKDKGGSLITANMAVDYNRDLFAFPGRPTDERNAGCNQLIKSQKAALIENAEDLILMMNWTAKKPQVIEPLLFDDFSEDEQILVNLIRSEEDGIHVNQLVMESKLSYSNVTSLLLGLEMKGVVKALPGGIYKAILN